LPEQKDRKQNGRFCYVANLDVYCNQKRRTISSVIVVHNAFEMSEIIRLYKHHVFSPHFIFIKGITQLSNSEILKLLGIKLIDEITIEQYSDSEDEILITRIGEWVHVIDNWYYKLWASENVCNKIKQLGNDYELFECSTGDSDESFEFQHYKNGNLVREYKDEDYRGGITTNFGDKLPNEDDILKEGNILLLVMKLAQSIGVEMPPKIEELQVCKIEI
jgi:hypothetical protein